MRRRRKGQPHKSNFEDQFVEVLTEAKLPVDYEPDRFEYKQVRYYKPDWKIADNVYVETKGLLTAADRGKLIRVLEQNPGLTVIMVFQNPYKKLNKRSKTTYAGWCDKNNIPWCTASAGELKMIIRQFM